MEIRSCRLALGTSLIKSRGLSPDSDLIRVLAKNKEGAAIHGTLFQLLIRNDGFALTQSTRFPGCSARRASYATAGLHISPVQETRGPLRRSSDYRDAPRSYSRSLRPSPFDESQ